MFSDETLRSAAHRPVTNDHPDEHVTSKNWKDYAVGQTGDEVTGEGIFIRVPLMVSIESAIIDIEAGKQELSAGVHLRPRFHRRYHASGRGLRRHSKEYPAQPRCHRAVRPRRKTGSHR